PQLRKRGHQGGLPPGGEAPGLARGTATGSCGDECPPAHPCGAGLLLDFVPATARIRLDTAPPLHEKRGAAPEPTGSAATWPESSWLCLGLKAFALTGEGR